MTFEDESYPHMYLVATSVARDSQPKSFSTLNRNLAKFQSAHMGGGTWFVFFDAESHDKQGLDAGYLLDLLLDGIEEEEEVAISVVEIEENMASYGAPESVDQLMEKMFALAPEDEDDE